MRRKLFLPCLFLLTLGLLLLATTKPAPASDIRHATNYQRLVVRATFSDPQMVRDLAAWKEPWEVNYARGYLVVDVTPEEYDQLVKAGFGVSVLRNLTAEYNRSRAPLAGQLSGIPGYPCYRTVEETLATADTIATNYPTLASWIDIGDSWEKTAGQGGYDLRVLKLTNSAIPGPKPALFVMSSVHAREYTPAELNTRFAEYLISHYGTDPDVTWLLDYQEVHLLLQANPDGRKQAETGQLWRKNTNQNYCSPTSSSRGADLNRNFEFQWGCCNGSSGSQCSDTFRGPNPASEPETQAIEAYVRSIFPDQRPDTPTVPAPVDATGVFLDIHSYSELVLWPWGYTGTPAPNGTALQTLGRKFAYFNDYYPEQAIGLYPTDGTTDDFAYGDLGVAAYTFELGTSFFQGCSTFDNTILPDNMPALLYAAKSARTPFLTPAGPESLEVALDMALVNAGIPVTLTALLNDTRFSNSNGVEPQQNIAAAEYSIDTPPWAAGLSAVRYGMSPIDGAFDSPLEGVMAVVDTNGLAGGRHILYVQGQDAAGNWGTVSAAFLYVTSGNEGVVSGVLSDEDTGQPIAGIIEETGLGLSASSDPISGHYTLPLPAGDNWTLRAAAPYHLDAIRSGVSVSDGSTTLLDIALTPTAGLSLPAEPLAMTLQQGQTADINLPIANLGNAPLEWVLTERNGGFMPALAHSNSLSTLLVDDDDNAPNMRPYYEAALTALGYSYTVFNVPTASANGPDAATMNSYDLVIWFSGDKYNSSNPAAGPNSVDEVQPAIYLDNGGQLFLSSQDYYYDHGSVTSFMADYLAVASVGSDAGNFTALSGVNEFAGLGPYPLSYPGTNYADTISPNGNGSLAFVGNGGEGAGLYTGNTVFLPMMWEAVQFNNSANGQAMLEAIINWLIPPDIPWLTPQTNTGTVAGNDSFALPLTLSATPPAVTAPGLYTGTLRIRSNDPANPVGEVVVKLTVEGGIEPLMTIPYRYWLNNSSSGSGQYKLYDNGSFTDGADAGIWLQQSDRLLLVYTPGSACNAVAIGVQVSASQYRGFRLCRDGSNVNGVWVGNILP